MVLLYQRVVLLLVVELIEQPFPRAVSAAVLCASLVLMEARAAAFHIAQVQRLHVSKQPHPIVHSPDFIYVAQVVSMTLVSMIAAVELRGAALLQAAASADTGPGAQSLTTGLAWFQWSLLFVPGVWAAGLLLRSRQNTNRFTTDEDVDHSKLIEMSH